MDTSQHCVSVPARLGQESVADTQPCMMENSSPALSVPSSTRQCHVKLASFRFFPDDAFFGSLRDH